MFSKVAIFASLLVVALSAPAEDPVAILSQDNDLSPDGTYAWSFESADGTKQVQAGVPKPAEDDAVEEVVGGSVVYSDPDGVKHELTYIADKDGYQPVGDDIPVAPEVPAQIARALEYIAQHPQKEEE